MTLLDALYIPAALLSAPVWALKKRAGWRGRFGHASLKPPTSGKPRVLLHAVSVGEVMSLRGVVPLLTPCADVVVSTTTDKGWETANKLFAATCSVVRYPIDLSWCVNRFLDAVRPNVVALTEGDAWPQFLRACASRRIPCGLISARVSERTFTRYRRLASWGIKPAWRGVDFIAAQDETYSQRFEQLGMDGNRVFIAGCLKWDAEPVVRTVEGADALARDMGIDRSRPLIVAGSTAEREESLLFRSLPAGAQLLCAPRKPEYFDAAAAQLPGCVRRSKPGSGDPSSRLFLLDSIGDLRRAYALADVVVLGRSFGTLSGSNPIEPAALGKPVIIGPRFGDFESIVGALRSAGALRVAPADGLADALRKVLSDPELRELMGQAGQACVESNRGCAQVHAEFIMGAARTRTPMYSEDVRSPERGNRIPVRA
ncbi:MAG TPA: glycosyltransferase N-terminal domain-containing protein [Phycisphaerales bacterium]|nr:glycosyltransferase N-terminal domain-containing protein [Phycisphaerales bacterium]